MPCAMWIFAWVVSPLPTTRGEGSVRWHSLHVKVNSPNWYCGRDGGCRTGVVSVMDAGTRAGVVTGLSNRNGSTVNRTATEVNNAAEVQSIPWPRMRTGELRDMV